MGTTTVPFWTLMEKRPIRKSDPPFSITLSYEEEEEEEDISSRNASAGFQFQDKDTSSLDLEKVPEDIFRRCFVSVLDRCLDEFYTLACIYATKAEPTVIKEIPYLTIQQRFGSSSSDYDNYSLGSVYKNAHKLQKEVSVILYLLEMCVEEVRKWGTSTMVREVMKNIERMRSDENDLMATALEKHEMFHYIRWSQKHEKYMSRTVIKSFGETIRDTQKTTLDAMEHASTEVKYVREWEKARHEQNQMKLEGTQTAYSQTILNVRWKIDLENTCHEQFEKYILETQKEYMDNIQDLMEDYETTLEKKDEEIYDLKTATERQKESYDALKAQYEQRAQAMEKWLEYKRKKKEAKELLARQIAAAIKIQGWWRRVMVRRNLGPYRKQKKEKGKGKDKGKKTTKNGK